MTDNILDVVLHGRTIGTLTLLAGSQTVFAFDEDYIGNRDRPTLSVSFKNSTGGLVTDVKPAHTRVPPFFANLLPEGPMRKYLADRAGVHPQQEFFLLWVLGQDLPGALAVRHPDRDAGPPGSAADPASRDTEAARAVMHFSLAGVQLKFSALLAADGGLTIPATGVDGSWIVKLPSPTYPAVPENEYAMLELARSIGIDVPEIKLIAPADISGLPQDMGQLEGPTLAIRRFDRLADGTAVHIEDFAQVFGVYPEDKYANANYRNLAEVIQAEAGTEAIKEFVRRLPLQGRHETLVGPLDRWPEPTSRPRAPVGTHSPGNRARNSRPFRRRLARRRGPRPPPRLRCEGDQRALRRAQDRRRATPRVVACAAPASSRA